jgi:hypothetical protein
MGTVVFHETVSVDGFVAGPNDEVDQLFRWYMTPCSAKQWSLDRSQCGSGAV